MQISEGRKQAKSLLFITVKQKERKRQFGLIHFDQVNYLNLETNAAKIVIY